MFFSKPKKKSDFHILIVDDEADFLSSMEYWFKSQGYAVQTAPDGAQAIELLKKNVPNIIFLDIKMPVMDGIETLKIIRKMRLKIPVIMLVAHPSEELRVAAYKYGANAFLEKSLDFYQAEHLINSLVRVTSKQKA
jgi:DNA-binding response OmpR family regulator